MTITVDCYRVYKPFWLLGTGDYSYWHVEICTFALRMKILLALCCRCAYVYERIYNYIVVIFQPTAEIPSGLP